MHSATTGLVGVSSLYMLLLLGALVQTTQSAAAPATVSSAFTIDLTCTKASDYCTKIKNVINLAGSYVADTVTFTVPVKVNATVVDFTDNRFLAQGMPTNTLLIKDSDGRPRLYPQALAQQKGGQSAVVQGQVFTPYDIDILINGNTPAWFPTAATTGIEPSEVDLSWTITHELLHGLGHLTSWRDHSAESTSADPTAAPPTTSNPYVTPYPFQYSVQTSSGATAMRYDGLTYLYPFDRYLVEIATGKTLDSYATIIDAIAPANTQFTSYDAYFAAIKANSAADAAATHVKALTSTPNSVAFKTDDGTLLTLDSDPSLPASFFDHLGPTFVTTQDLLMYSTTPYGMPYANAVLKAGGTHPIGNRTQALLRTLGYSVKTPQIVLSASTLASSAMSLGPSLCFIPLALSLVSL